MATRVWEGNAGAVAQVTDLTVGGTIETSDIFIVTIGDKAVSVVGGSTSATTVATAIYDAIVALDPAAYPEFAEITWSNPSAGVIRATGPLGVPFTVTPTTTETGGGAADAQTFSGSTTTAATGPNFVDNTANWSGAAVPVNGDDVIISDSTVSLLYELDTLASVTLNSLRIFADFTGTIGLPINNALGYVEYRARYLQVSAGSSKVFVIGEGDGPGSGRIHLDCGAIDSLSIKVLKTGQPQNAGDEAFRLLISEDSSTASTLDIASGSVGLASEANQTSKLATVRVGNLGDQLGDVTFRAGSGNTAFALTAAGSDLETACALTTVVLYGGQWLHIGGAVTSLTNYGATIRYHSTGTCSAYIGAGEGAAIDFSGDLRSRTFSTVDLFAGAEWNDPNATVTYSAGIDANRCHIASRRTGNVVYIDAGPNRRWTPGTPA